MSKQSKKDLIESERQYRAVVEDQMELVSRYRPDCKIFFANESYCRHHGKSRSEIVGKSFLPYLKPQDREEVLKFIKTVKPNYPIAMFHQRIIKNDGSTLWVEWQRRAFFDDAGNLIEVQGVGRDITEFKKAELDLKSSEESLQKKNLDLDKKNIALSEVLEQVESQKQQIKKDVITNVEDLLIPIIEQLLNKGSKIDKQYLNLLKRSLENLTSSFGRKITQKSLNLTSREIQICNMIKRGLTSKEIAGLLNISYNTVGRHRHGMRKKFNITNRHVNLCAFIQDF